MSDSKFRIFISWSKSPSKEVAAVVSDWLQLLFDDAEPWYSDKDIIPGTQSINEIHSNLEDADAGILLVTQANQNNPWINYEAGVLAQRVSSSLVIPILIDADSPTALTGPLGRLQNATLSQDQMQRVAEGLATKIGLDKSRLIAKFDRSWPEFEAKFKVASKARQPAEALPPGRSDSDKLDELLQIVRSMRSADRHGSEPRDSGLSPLARDLLERVLNNIVTQMKRILGDEAVFAGMSENRIDVAVPVLHTKKAESFANYVRKNWGYEVTFQGAPELPIDTAPRPL